MTEDVVKHLKPIPPDPVMEKMDKKSMAYRYKLKRLQCITCFNTATQWLVYELEGCTKIERYCDACASKQK